MNFWEELGFIRYPLAIVAIFLLVQTARAMIDLKGGAEESAGSGELRVHTVLLWGILGAALGVLGTLVGVVMIARYMEGASAADIARDLEQTSATRSALVWGGVRVALSSSVVGLLMLGYAAIAWLGLQAARARRFGTAS